MLYEILVGIASLDVVVEGAATLDVDVGLTFNDFMVCGFSKALLVDLLTDEVLPTYMLIRWPLFSFVASVDTSRVLAIMELRILRRSVEPDMELLLLVVADGACMPDGLRMLDVELLTLSVLDTGAGKPKDSFDDGIDVFVVGSLVETLGGLSLGIAGFLNSKLVLTVEAAGSGMLTAAVFGFGGDGSFVETPCWRGGERTTGLAIVVSSTTGRTKPFEEMRERRFELLASVFGRASIGAMVDSLAISTSASSMISRVLFKFSSISCVLLRFSLTGSVLSVSIKSSSLMMSIVRFRFALASSASALMFCVTFDMPFAIFLACWVASRMSCSSLVAQDV